VRGAGAEETRTVSLRIEENRGLTLAACRKRKEQKLKYEESLRQKYEKELLKLDHKYGKRLDVSPSQIVKH